ncbi:MAG: hypothetical protein VW397_07615 [Candidatus Margulisiibacteriota bacterium]
MTYEQTRIQTNQVASDALSYSLDINLGEGVAEFENASTLNADSIAAKLIEKKNNEKDDVRKKSIKKQDDKVKGDSNLSFNSDVKEAGRNNRANSRIAQGFFQSIRSFFSFTKNDKERLEILKQQSSNQAFQMNELETEINHLEFDALTRAGVPHADILKSKSRNKENQSIDAKTKLSVQNQFVQSEIKNIKSKGVN